MKTKLLIILVVCFIGAAQAETFHLGKGSSYQYSTGSWGDTGKVYCRYTGKVSDTRFSMFERRATIYYPINAEYVYCGNSSWDRFKMKVLEVNDMYIKLEK